MPGYKQFNVEVDKLTRSIENAISGDCFKTDVLPVIPKDLKNIKSKDWVFDWKEELKNQLCRVYKLVIVDNVSIIQGMISIEDKGDHYFMHLIESSKFNKGKKKVYIGVPGNLIAFACKESFKKGYEGYVSFESKSRLVTHYELTLGAKRLFGNYW